LSQQKAIVGRSEVQEPFVQRCTRQQPRRNLTRDSRCRLKKKKTKKKKKSKHEKQRKGLSTEKNRKLRKTLIKGGDWHLELNVTHARKVKMQDGHAGTQEREHSIRKRKERGLHQTKGEDVGHTALQDQWRREDLKKKST